MKIKNKGPLGTSCMSVTGTYFTNKFKVSIATHLQYIAHNNDLLTTFLLSHIFSSTILRKLHR